MLNSFKVTKLFLFITNLNLKQYKVRIDTIYMYVHRILYYRHLI